jgi:hypothetical protein
MTSHVCIFGLLQLIPPMPLADPTLEAIVSKAMASIHPQLPPPISAVSFPHFAAHIDAVVTNSWKDSTLAGYQLSMNQFLTFCSANNIHSSFTLPANEFLLCAFATFEAGSRSGGAIANNMSGIQAWHILNGVHYQGGICLAYTIHGAQWATPADSKWPACPPVTIDMLILLHSYLSSSNLLDATCLAAADCATWGQAHLGEFLPVSQAKFSPRYFPTVANLCPISTTGCSRMLFLPWSKTACKCSEDLFLGCQHTPSDLIASLDNHLSINPLLPCLHLFAYLGPSGSLVPLTKQKFLSRCNDVWSQHGYPAISGHSF